MPCTVSQVRRPAGNGRTNGAIQGYIRGYTQAVPKINVYLPERLAMAVRQFEVPVSGVCQRALESEVASRLPLLEMTPRARSVLIEALRQANQLGHDFVGVEHIVLAILQEGHSVPAQVIASLGVTESLRARLNKAMSTSLPSNQVIDHDGNLLGYLVGDEPRLVSLDGKRLRIVTDEAGNEHAIDEEGNRQPKTSANAAPRLLALDEAGRPVVVPDVDASATGGAPG